MTRRRSVLMIAALLAANIIFAVDRVPLNETVYDINGNQNPGGQEAISTFSCNKYENNFQSKNGIKPAEKANAQEADGLRDSIKNDFTPVNNKPIDAFLYQGTPKPLSTDDHIAGAKQLPDSLIRNNSHDQQARKQGISPDLKRHNTTNSQLQDGRCLSDFSIQQDFQTLYFKFRKFECMQVCKGDIFMLDDKIKNQIQSVKAEIQSKEGITPPDQQLMYTGTYLVVGSTLSHQTQTSAPDTPLTKLYRTKDVAHVVHVAHSSAFISASTNTLSGQNILKKSAVLGAFNRVKVTTETSHGTTAASTFSEGTPFSIAAIAPTLKFNKTVNSQIFANPNLRFTFVKLISDCSIISPSGDRTDNNSKTAPNSNPASQQTSKVTAHSESITASSCNSADKTCLNSYFTSASLQNPNQCSLFDPARISNTVDKAQMACQGEKVCGVSLDAVVTSKQSKTVPHPEENLDSPEDPITSRANNTTEKVYSKKKANPCYCLLEELSKNLTKFLKSSDFRRMHIGDSPRAQTISLNETVSEECGEHCWYQLCGQLTFTAQSSHSKPFGGLSWAEHHTQNHFKGRKLAGASIPSGYCLGLTTNFNLLDNTVQASQSDGEPPGGGCTNGECNANANQGCDGVIKSTQNGRVHVHQASDYFWVANLQSSKWIQSILYIESDYTANVRFRVGELTTNGYQDNSLCLVGQLTKGGWINCARQGQYLALTSNDHFEFMEVMAYSEKFIHHQASSLTLLPGTLTTASPYRCTTLTNCQASNAITTSLVIWNNQPATQSCCIYSTPSLNPTLTITFPWNVMIAFVVIIPSDQDTIVTTWQNGVQVIIVNAQNLQEVCGTLGDYNTYQEVPCNRVGHTIIIKRIGSDMTLSMAGLGIMTPCDCSQTSFDPLLLPPVISYALSGSSTDALKTVKVMPDTVSSICGSADGYSFCPHIVRFTDSSNIPVTFPYNGFSWNPATFDLTLDPAQALQFCQLNAIVSLKNNPLVTRTQVITSTIIQAPSTPAAPLTAISGTTDVAITWAAPADGGSPITGYTVDILQSDGTYSTYAGCTGIAVSCTVPISVLQAGPYNLVAGSSVFAKVLAQNSINSSAYSLAGNGAVLTAPSAPAAPITAIQGTDVTITWLAPASGSTPITGYTVDIVGSNGSTYTTYAGCTGIAVSCTVPISVLQAAPYNLADGASVFAKVKATNSIGSSAYSSAGNGAVLPKIPQTPVKPTTTISGTNVVVNWVAPADGGSVITDYAVTIKKSDGTWSAPLAICTGTAVSCTVTNTLLQSAPYNLPNGASVHAQVQAINSRGSSVASPSGNGAVLADVPITPEAPTTSIQTTNVLVTWKAPADGGSEITGYKVAIRKSDGTWSAPLISCTGTAVSCSIPISVLQAAPYNIAKGTSIYASVIATNLAGNSSASNPGNGAVVKPNPLSIFIPDLTLNAVIGQEASLLLPPLAGAVYIVFNRPQYQLSVDDNLLQLKSESDLDIGSQKLKMNARASGVSGNFTVNVIFSKARTATNTTNTSVTENLPLSVLESDSLLKTTLFCTTKEAEILSCVTDKGYSYLIDPKKIVGFVKLAEEPILTVSRVNSRGQFFLKFSQAMKIEAFKNTTYYKRHLEANATTQNDTLVQYKYLLSPKHLRIEVMKDGSTTQPVFTWYARNITNTTIEMQLVFEDPKSISNDRKQSHTLNITVLPPALRFFQTISSGQVAKNPLANFIRKLPPQVKLGSVMDYVIQGAEIMEKSAQYSALTNLAVQLAVSGSMAQMWSMVNAFQIVNSFNYLETDVPGNVLMVMTKFNDMLELSALETGQITSAVFNFTETQSPGAAFTEMGVDSKVLTKFIGNLFYIGLLGLAAYLLYGLVLCCGKSNKTCRKFQLWLSLKLIFSAALCYQLETSLDFGIGSLLKFEEPNLTTGSDIFDFSLSIGAVICLLVLPLTQVTCLWKNKGHMDDRKFKQKWGSLYTELKTYTPEQRETATKMLSWFLFRRIVTALNLVELRDQTIWLQLTFNMYLCLADACVNFHWYLYERNLRNIMEKLNSFVVLLLSQLMYMQTDLIKSEADRYYIGYYYLGVIGLMFLVNMSVVIVAASISATEKCKKCHVQRQHTEARAIRKEQMKLKNLRVAQKNVVDGPLPSRRTLLLLEISAQKRKPVVDEARLKQLQDRLVALDNNLRDQRSNVPQEVLIESDLEMGSSHRQAQRLVDQINEFTFYENQKKQEQKNSIEQSLSEIESEELQMSSVPSSNEDQSERIHKEVALSIRNKAQLIRQPNEDKTTPTQVANRNRDTGLQWKIIQNSVVPANKETQEPARLKPRNRKLITKSLPKPVEPFSFRDICINDSEILNVNKSYPLGHLEKHFEKVRNYSNDKPLVFSQVNPQEETKTQGSVDRREMIHKKKIRVQEAEINYIQEQKAVLLNSLQKKIQACDEISVLLETASEVAWAALQKEARQIEAEMVKTKAQIRELQEQLAFHKAELDRLWESHQL